MSCNRVTCARSKSLDVDEARESSDLRRETINVGEHIIAG
jgi:hypothetical protein